MSQNHQDFIATKRIIVIRLTQGAQKNDTALVQVNWWSEERLLDNDVQDLLQRITITGETISIDSRNKPYSCLHKKNKDTSGTIMHKGVHDSKEVRYTQTEYRQLLFTWYPL